MYFLGFYLFIWERESDSKRAQGWGGAEGEGESEAASLLSVDPDTRGLITTWAETNQELDAWLTEPPDAPHHFTFLRLLEKSIQNAYI